MKRVVSLFLLCFSFLFISNLDVNAATYGVSDEVKSKTSGWYAYNTGTDIVDDNDNVATLHIFFNNSSTCTDYIVDIVGDSDVTYSFTNVSLSSYISSYANYLNSSNNVKLYIHDLKCNRGRLSDISYIDEIYLRNSDNIAIINISDLVSIEGIRISGTGGSAAFVNCISECPNVKSISVDYFSPDNIIYLGQDCYSEDTVIKLNTDCSNIGLPNAYVSYSTSDSKLSSNFWLNTDTWEHTNYKSLSKGTYKVFRNSFDIDIHFITDDISSYNPYNTSSKSNIVGSSSFSINGEFSNISSVIAPVVQNDSYKIPNGYNLVSTDYYYKPYNSNNTFYNCDDYISLDADTDTYIIKKNLYNSGMFDEERIPIIFVLDPIEYKITYKTNGGTLDSNVVNTYTIEDSVSLPTPTRNGYKFDGWYTTSGFKGGTEISEISKGTTSNVFLYAKWSCLHESNKVVGYVEPTCCEEGSTGTVTCGDCGRIKAPSTIPATGNHVKKVVNLKTATCITEGFTGDTYCNLSGKLLSSGVVTKINSNNHANLEVRNSSDATCAKDGYTGDIYCKDCGSLVKTGSSISKTTNHEWVVGVLPSSLSSEDGAIGTYCLVCETLKPNTDSGNKESDKKDNSEEVNKSKSIKAKISKVTNLKGKKVQLKLKKVTGYRYEIKVCTSKKFNKSVKTYNTSKTTYTIKKLKKGKTYYIKVRTYKVIDNKKIYGKWSTIKKIKIKK